MSEAKIAPIPDLGTRTDEITIFAGPCSVESAEQFEEVAECVAGLGLTWIRGGAFKPRTNPHSFQGLGEEALKIMRDSGEKHGLKTLTEVMDSAHCELVHSYVDGLQVGARNFQNFSLLKKIGQVTAESHKMVLYKRGFAGTIAEWLAATDYLTAEGNDNVVLCERGIRTFETATRFTLDIAAIPVIHKQSLCPVCIDVSHPAGQRDLVPSLAKAAVAVVVTRKQRVRRKATNTLNQKLIVKKLVQQYVAVRAENVKVLRCSKASRSQLRPLTVTL